MANISGDAGGERGREWLRQSEERYRAFVAQSSEGIWRFELAVPMPTTLAAAEQIEHVYAHGWLAECNDAMARMYGHRIASDILGARLGDMMPKDDPMNVAYLTAFIEGGYRLSDAESSEIDRDGRPRHFLNNLVGIVENGLLLRAWGTQRDVTQARRAEAERRASDERYRQLADAMPQLVWTCDANGVIDYYNERLSDYIPIGSDGAERWKPLVHPDDLAGTRRAWKRAREAGQPYEHEHRLRMRDGSYRWHLSRARPGRDADGNIVKWYGTATDVEQSRESETRYRTLFASIDAGFCLAEMIVNERGEDIDYRFLEVNPPFEWHTGLKEAAGRTALELIPGLERHWIETYGEVARTGKPRRFVQGSGVMGRWFDVYAFPIEDPSHRRFGLLFTDITEKRRAEEELKQNDRRKDEFLATLAHELRNPLAPLRNGLEIMQLAADNPPVVAQARAMMDRQLAQLVRLIDDLMDVSRISRGKIQLRKSPVALGDVVTQAIETSRPAIDAASHALHVDVAPEPVLVDADATRLVQVFANLLNNAAKFTPRGGRIDVTVTRQRGEAVASVRDNGIGIDAPSLKRVFDMFVQADNSPERERGGLGIGLSLVRGLVELHGGRVDGYSEGPRRGSEFVVRLPLATSDADRAAPAPPPRDAKGRRVLVVDDNRDAANSLVMMLGVIGHHAQCAYDAEGALELGDAFRPDVVVLDLGMPKVSGYEASRRVRDREWGRDAMLIALTGWGQEEDRRRSASAGFDAHLVKPVDPDELQRLLER